MCGAKELDDGIVARFLVLDVDGACRINGLLDPGAEVKKGRFHALELSQRLYIFLDGDFVRFCGTGGGLMVLRSRWRIAIEGH